MIEKDSIVSDRELTYYIERPFRFKIPSRDDKCVNFVDEDGNVVETISLKGATYLANPDDNLNYSEEDIYRMRSVRDYGRKVLRWKTLNQMMKTKLIANPVAFVEDDYMAEEKERNGLWEEIKWLFEDTRFINLNKTQTKRLYDKLIELKLLQPDTAVYEDFLYVFCQSKPQQVGNMPIMWNANVQLLRELLEGLMNRGYITIHKAEIERRVPHFFTNKKGDKISLAKPKIPEADRSYKNRKLADFLATL